MEEVPYFYPNLPKKSLKLKRSITCPEWEMAEAVCSQFPTTITSRIDIYIDKNGSA